MKIWRRQLLVTSKNALHGIFRGTLLALFPAIICAGAGASAGDAPGAVPPVAPAAVVAPPPAEIPLHDGWSFFRFPPTATFDPENLPAAGWERVTLPHTARLEARVFTEQWQGDALYRRQLFVPRAWEDKAIWLRFEGAMMVAEIYLNGVRVFKHQGGYLPFTLDLSGLLQVGEYNQLLVHLDNRDNPITGPKPLELLDFNYYGGLYREVRLFVRERLHITDEMLADRVAGGGIFVTYPHITPTRAQVSVKTHIANTGPAPRHFKVKHIVMDGAQRVASSVSETLTLGAMDDVEHSAILTVAAPKLWSPRTPALYTLTTHLEEGDRLLDARTTPIGIRRIEIGADGLAINGQKMFLRGVNRHQEYPYVGYALSPNADYRDAKLIKEAGFDYVRLSHYPHSRHFMRAADEIGLVLLNAILGWQYYNPTPAFAEHVKQTCRDLIRRDRNHPSVLAWECSLNESQMPTALVDALHDIVHQECPGGQAYSAGWTRRGYDIFLEARQHRLRHPGRPLPNKPYIVSEYGDWEYYAQNAGLNQEQWQDLSAAARSSRQLLAHGETRLMQQATNVQEAHNDNLSTPALADGYWVMFDYNRGYAADLEASGLMSLERIAKPAYYFFRSQRAAEELSAHYASGPFVHIASEWRADSPRPVRVYANADMVELFLNGTSLGRQAPDRDRISSNLRQPPFTFAIPHFEAGTLAAVAYAGGTEVARHTVTTPGAAVRVMVELATQGIKPVANDVLFVHASIIDAKGTTVPVTGRTVEFTVSDDLEFVGPDSVSSENGTAAVLVRVKQAHGEQYVAARMTQ